ncbi:DUF2312 domain-containing protein [Sphingomonas sp. RS6]
MRQERAADGSLRHVPTPFVPATSKAKGKKARRPADPIKANPESAAQQLAKIVERIERMEDEKAGLCDDIKDAYSEAKSVGFDTKGVRAIVALRKLDPHVRQEAEAILETYKTALGII